MRTSKATEPYLFTSKTYRGDCGAYYVGDSSKGAQGSVYLYYRCFRRKNNGGAEACKAPRFVKDVLEGYLVDYTRKTVLQPSNIAAIAKAAEALQKADRSLLDNLEAQHVEVIMSIENLHKAIERGVFTAKTMDRTSELETCEESLKAQIEQEKIAVSIPEISASTIAMWLESFRDGHATNPDFNLRMIDALVNNVIVHQDHLTVR